MKLSISAFLSFLLLLTGGVPSAGRAADVTPPSVKITGVTLDPPGGAGVLFATIMAAAEDDSGLPITVELRVEDLGLSLGKRVLDPRVVGPANPLVWSWAAPPPGEHKCVAWATDESGNLGGSEGFPVVIPGVTPTPKPTFRIVSPVPGQVFPAGADVLVVTESQVDGETCNEVHINVDGQEVGVTYLCCPECLCPVPLPGGWEKHSFLWKSTPGVHKVAAKAVCGEDGVLAAGPVEFVVGGDPNPDGTPVVSLETVSQVASEDNAAEIGIVKIRRTGSVKDGLMVYFTTGGNAAWLKDYHLIPESMFVPCPACLRPEIILTETRIQIPAGSDHVLLGVRAIRDDWIEGTEAVVLELQGPPVPAFLGAKPSYVIGSESAAKIAVMDSVPLLASLNITVPAEGSQYRAPATVVIETTAVDPKGSIRHVEYYANGNAIGVSDILTKDADIPGRPRHHRFEWSPVPAGSYEIVAKAVGAGGEGIKSEPVRIDVIVGTLPLPKISVYPSDAEAYENDPNDELVFKVVRTGDLTEELHVHFDLDGSASYPGDYERVLQPLDGNGVPSEDTAYLPDPAAKARRGLVVIPAGETSAALVFRPVPDKAIEGAESVVVRLALPVPAPWVRMRPTYEIGEPSEAKGVIYEQRPTPKAQIVITSPGDFETFGAPATISVTAVAVDPAGYIPRLVFLANGQKIGVSEIFFIRAPDPGTPIQHGIEWSQVPEGKYALTARAEAADGSVLESAPVHVVVLGPTSGRPVVRLETLDDLAAEDDPANIGVFRLVRTGDIAAPLEVFFVTEGAATRGKDYIVIPEEAFVPCVGCKRLDLGITGDSVTIPAGKASIGIGIRALSDQVREGGETAAIVLREILVRGEAFPLAPYTVGSPAGGKVLIVDSSRPAASLTFQSPVDGAWFKVPADIPIRVTTVDPAGYLPHVMFFGDGAVIGESRIDFIREPDPGTPIDHEMVWKDVPVGVHVIEARAVGADPGGWAVSGAIKVQVIGTGDVPVVGVVAGNPRTVEPGSLVPGDGTGPATFVLTRTGNLDNPLVVYYAVSGSASNGRDYVGLDGDAIIPAGQSSRVIDVHALPDGLLEGDETVVLQLRGSRAYEVGQASVAKVVIGDGDLPSGPAVVLSAPRTGSRFVAGQDVTLSMFSFDPAGVINPLEVVVNGRVLDTVGLAFPECVGCGPKPGDVLPFTYVWKQVPAGEYSMVARGYGSRSAVRTLVESEPVLISVVRRAPEPFVLRDLPDSVVPGKTFGVRLKASPEAGVLTYAIEDVPPAGWVVGKISEGGSWDAVTGKVKFGPFLNGLARGFEYEVTPPQAGWKRGVFSGSGSADGTVTGIGGDFQVASLSAHPADLSPENGAIALDEVSAYATAWKAGKVWPSDPNPIPVDYVTRAGALWKGGEAYVVDPSIPAPPLWWVNPGALPPSVGKGAVDGGAGEDGGAGAALHPVDSESIPDSVAVVEILSGAADSFEVVVRVVPRPGVAAWAVEGYVRPAVAAAEVTEAGTYDPSTGVVRWGPFYDANARMLTARLKGNPEGVFAGVVSFDGSSRTVVAGVGRAAVTDGGLVVPGQGGGSSSGPRIIHLERRPDGVVQLLVANDEAAGGSRGCDLEVSDDLKVWRKIGQVGAGAGCVAPLDPDANESVHRYYRIVPRP